MNPEITIDWDDTVLPFQLDATDTRGRVARLDGVLSGILRQHDYPASVEALIADLKKAKPASAKGTYFKKIVISTTMGAGIPIDQASLEL